MSAISELGSQICAAQAAMGLDNPRHYNPGLGERQRSSTRLLTETFHGTELVDLFAWRNGVTLDLNIAMTHLWIIPGFFLLSAESVEEEHRYFFENIAN